jgi:hypothetical protein
MKKFRAAGPTVTIHFSAESSDNAGDYIGIDNVSLRRVCAIFEVVRSIFNNDDKCAKASM